MVRRGSAFIAHGGGPTAVLNASLLGVIQQARAVGIRHLWAPLGGFGGVLSGDFVDLLSLPARQVAKIENQCGSLIGSFRGKISAEHVSRTLEFFRTRDVRYFVYTGGNGSMGTALRIAGVASEAGYELMTLGIPKTIDNDICETDHCPGFGSAARFVATAVRDAGLDQRALPTPVSIFEVMGRNTGWLAAASLLARERPGDPPHLIYVPELPFDPQEFLERVDRLLSRQGWVVGVVAEGLRDASGRMLGAAGGSSRDAKGRPLAGNVAAYLARLVSQKLKVRARSEKPGLLCRAFAPCRSPVDAAEALDAGKFAVRAALHDHSKVMVSIRRMGSRRYSYSLSLVPLDRVADRERRLPREHLHAPAGIRDSYLAYAAPLIGPGLEASVYVDGGE